MISYIIRRTLLGIPVLLGVILVVSLSLEMVPGDPAELMLGQFATPEAVKALRTDLGLDRPFVIRYFDYVFQVFRGDLGVSVTLNTPVLSEIAVALPNTLMLAGASVFIVIVVSIPLGVLSAAHHNTFIDNIIRVVSLLGVSMPVFWTGIILIIIFSLWLRILPTGGTGGLKHLVLPAITLAAPSIGMVTRMTRSSLIEVLDEDYITTARSKSVPERWVLFKHGLRNALIPVVTVLGAQLGQMLGGAILTETVFAWPGMGRLIVHAVTRRDYVLIQGVALVYALTYLMVNLLVDLSYAYINPKIRYN